MSEEEKSASVAKDLVDTAEFPAIRIRTWRDILFTTEGLGFLFSVLTLLVTAIGVLVASYQFLRVPAEPSSEYEAQIENLNAIDSTLDDLKSFVENEKERLRETELTLEALQEEQAKLQPVVEADRETVEAILSLDRERNRRDIWFDWVVAFFSGVVSSLAATYIVSTLVRWRGEVEGGGDAEPN